MKIVEKKWGREEWIVNNKWYCGKFLYVRHGGKSSYHYHRKKRETFVVTDGTVTMTVNGERFKMHCTDEPITIPPRTPHSFESIIGAVIIEVSTPHKDEDVVRLSESK